MSKQTHDRSSCIKWTNHEVKVSLSVIKKRVSDTIKIQRPKHYSNSEGRRNRAHQLHFLWFGHGWTTSTSSFTAIPIWSRGCWEQTFKLWYIYFWSTERNIHNVMSEGPKYRQRRKSDNWVAKYRNRTRNISLTYGESRRRGKCVATCMASLLRSYQWEIICTL